MTAENNPIQQIASQVLGAIQSDSGVASKLAADPASTIKEITGIELSGDDLSAVVTAVSHLVKGEDVDFGNLATLAKDMLSEHGGDLMSTLGSLFGGKDDDVEGEQEQAEPAKDDADEKKGEKESGKGDGFGLDDVLDIAGSLFGGK